MSPEFTPPQQPETPIATPESLEKCADLYQKILSQIEEWQTVATRHHPSISGYSMASLINRDCAVDEQGNPVTDTPRLGQDRDEKMNQQARAERMRLIAPYANDATIDGASFKSQSAQNYFDTIEAHASVDSTGYSEFVSALKKVARIVKVRERLAEQIDYLEYNGQINELVQDIVYRLIQDVNR